MQKTKSYACYINTTEKNKRKTSISSGQNSLHSVAEKDTTAPIETEEAERIQRLKEVIPLLQELTIRLIEEGKLKPFNRKTK